MIPLLQRPLALRWPLPLGASVVAHVALIVAFVAAPGQAAPAAAEAQGPIPIELAFVSPPEEKPAPPPEPLAPPEPVVEPPVEEPKAVPVPVRRPPPATPKPVTRPVTPPVRPPPSVRAEQPASGDGKAGGGAGALGLAAAHVGPAGLAIQAAGTGARSGHGTGGIGDHRGQGPSSVSGPGNGKGSGEWDLTGYASRLRRAVLSRRQYPLAARRMQLQGEALVRVTLARDGTLVGKPQLLRSTRHPMLDGEALRMVEAARPFPSLPAVSSRPTADFVIPIRFTLDL